MFEKEFILHQRKTDTTKRIFPISHSKELSYHSKENESHKKTPK